VFNSEQCTFTDALKVYKSTWNTEDNGNNQ